MHIELWTLDRNWIKKEAYIVPTQAWVKKWRTDIVLHQRSFFSL